MADQAVRGTIEVLVGGGDNPDSLPTEVAAVTVDEVPLMVKIRHGITGLTAVEPTPPNPQTSRVPVAAWRATTADGRPVEVRLWEELPFDETAIGQALAAGLADAEPAE